MPSREDRATTGAGGSGISCDLGKTEHRRVRVVRDLEVEGVALETTAHGEVDGHLSNVGGALEEKVTAREKQRVDYTSTPLEYGSPRLACRKAFFWLRVAERHTTLSSAACAFAHAEM
eukprot:CAMPEP_0183362418 /NCGR_PEP_ID=MMETSP0164_2-20130417/69257_1 /TAXON_ID=221442 /ORGANISM="Coccolithus pelagicus ssp braarudi, Strain PLY182g" /LENGTH=117 /DNA_ID=CAMNT_0025537287 /DNA_START=130 /DNA_END=481 /DNA_ORIENTATION=-